MIVPFDTKHIELKDGLIPFVRRLNNNCDRDYSIFNPNLTKKHKDNKPAIFQLQIQDNTFKLRRLLVGTYRSVLSNNQTFTVAFGDLKLKKDKLKVTITTNWLGWTIFSFGLCSFGFLTYQIFNDSLSGISLYILFGGLLSIISTLWQYHNDKEKLIEFLIKNTEHNNR